jgi:hypothetical protein
MTALKRAILPILLALAGCQSVPQVPTEEVITHPPTSCGSACANAARLCGPQALKPANASCAEVCIATENGGGDFRTGCLSAAQTCAQIQVCAR